MLDKRGEGHGIQGGESNTNDDIIMATNFLFIYVKI